MKSLISTLILGAGLVLGGCGDRENADNGFKRKIEVYDRPLETYMALEDSNSQNIIAYNKEKECSCLPEIGLPPKLKLTGCYDIDDDGDLDCIYKQDSTQRIILYETRDNGHGHTLAGEFSKQD